MPTHGFQKGARPWGQRTTRRGQPSAGPTVPKGRPTGDGSTVNNPPPPLQAFAACPALLDNLSLPTLTLTKTGSPSLHSQTKGLGNDTSAYFLLLRELKSACVQQVRSWSFVIRLKCRLPSSVPHDNWRGTCLVKDSASPFPIHTHRHSQLQLDLVSLHSWGSAKRTASCTNADDSCVFQTQQHTCQFIGK